VHVARSNRVTRCVFLFTKKLKKQFWERWQSG